MELKKIYEELNTVLDSTQKITLNAASAEEMTVQSAILKDVIRDSAAVSGLQNKQGVDLAVLTAYGDVVADTQSAIIAAGGYSKMLSNIDKAYDLGGGLNTSESAMGAAINDSQKVTLMVNAARTNQNEFAEEFFPSILAPDGTNQIKLQYIAAGFITEWTKGNKEITPAFKMLKDTSFLQGLNHKLFPIFDAASTDIVPALKYVEVNGKKDVETAPYVFGKKLDLLDICSDEVAVSGSINNVRTIAPTSNLNKVFFANADKSTRLVLKTNGLKNNAATPTLSGKIEDIQFNFGIDTVFNVALKDYKNAAGASILPAYTDVVVGMELVVKGDGNITRAQLTMQQPSFAISYIKLNGSVLATDDATYTAVLAEIADVVPVGFALDLFEANGDLFNEGTLLTLDNDTELYNIGYKEPFTVKGSVVDLFTKNLTDMQTLASYVTHFGDKTSAIATSVLLDAVEVSKIASGTQDNSTTGIGNRFVTPTAISKTIDIETVLNNMESSNKEVSLQAALVSAIKVIAIQLLNDSGYKAIYNRVYPGRKIRLAVGIGEKLAGYLPTSKIDLTQDVEMVVVSTPDNRMNDKMIMAFTANDSSRNKEVDQLSFGFCGYAPTVVAEVKKTIGSSAVSIVAGFPMYQHHVLTNVMGEITLANVNKIFTGL